MIKVTADREDLGYLLHSALRKEVHSTASAIAWQIINIMNPGEFGEYLNVVFPDIDGKNFKSVNALVRVLKKSSLEKYDYIAKPAPTILHCAFQLFTNDDWIGYATYLYENGDGK